MHNLIQSDCLDWLMQTDQKFDCVFMDPPDNIGLKYDGFTDKFDDYYVWLQGVIIQCLDVAPVVWVSFNAKHVIPMGYVSHANKWRVKTCVQTFTFGQHRKTDLGNCHRPLWRISKPATDVKLYPEQIKVKSQRQIDGDPRAAEGGKVPGDVFDFPRVVGNSKQRRSWHPTQLHEGLVGRCVKLVTKPGDRVLDPFGGTGTTLRVCKDIGRDCTLIEFSNVYCEKLIEEHPDLSFDKPTYGD